MGEINPYIQNDNLDKTELHSHAPDDARQDKEHGTIWLDLSIAILNQYGCNKNKGVERSVVRHSLGQNIIKIPLSI